MNLLREEREARGWSKPRLALELEQRAGRHGVRLAARASLLRMIAQWENGHRSANEPYRSLFCDIYGKTAEELGLAPTGDRARSDVGLAYKLSLEAAVSSVSDLSHFDLNRHTAILLGRYSPDAANAACLDWLVGVAQHDLRTTTRRVSKRDVAEIQVATAAFDNLDRQFGGDHSRELATKYLHDVVIPTLRGRCEPKIQSELFASTAVLCELIGWMSYDSGRHLLAERYFIQALRLAGAAGHRAYGAFTLTSMSHQALYLRQPHQALRLALVAKDAASRSNVPALVAEAASLEALAHAALGTSTACGEALEQAEQAMLARTVDNTPPFAAGLTDTVFASYAGTAWTQLGRPDEATRFLTMVASESNGQGRRHVYASVQLARVALIERDLDRACELGQSAAETAAALASRRSTELVVRLGRKLAQEYGNTAQVRHYLDLSRQLMIEQPDSDGNGEEVR